jgi:hypothetical protein
MCCYVLQPYPRLLDYKSRSWLQFYSYFSSPLAIIMVMFGSFLIGVGLYCWLRDVRHHQLVFDPYIWEGQVAALP